MDYKAKAEKLASKPHFINVVRDVTTDEEPVFIALSLELEGCMGQGITVDEAIEDLEKARVDFIRSLLEDGLPVPAPCSFDTMTSSSMSETITNVVSPSRPNVKWHGVKSNLVDSRSERIVIPSIIA